MRPVAGTLRATLRQRRWLLLVDTGLLLFFAAYVVALYFLSDRVAPAGLRTHLLVFFLGVVSALAMLAWAWLDLRRDTAAAERLHESEADLDLLTSQAPANVWTTDTELRLTSVFGALVAELDNPSARVPGSTLYDLFETRDEQHPAIAAHLRALKGESATYERRVGDRFLEGRVEPLRDGEGRVVGCVGTAMDVSTWRWAESQVRRLAALVQSSEDAIISIDVDGTIEIWNPAAERLYGYRAQEVIGRPLEILAPPERLAELRSNLEHTRRGHRVVPYETERVRRDGVSIAVSVTDSPVVDGAGRVLGMSGIHRDISARKQADDALRHLAAIVESSDDAIISTDEARVIRTWNPGAERLYGYTAAEAVGKNIDTLILAPGAQEDVDAVARRLARGAAVVRYEGTRVRKDGSLVEVAGAASTMRNASGVLTGYTSIVRDVTLRKRTDEALRQSEAMFRLLTENATDIVSRHAPDGTFIYVSPACRKLLDYDPQELVGRSPYEFIHPHDAGVASRSANVFDLPNDYAVTFRFRRKDGTYVWFESLGRTIRGPATGAVTEIQAVSRDVTDRIRVERQLRTQGEELRALARHLESVREEEHTAIAREIHDGLGQALTALRLDLSWVARKLPDASAAVRQKIGAMVALADETIEAGRGLVAELRPPILDDLGLAPSLEWYVHRFAKRAGLRCEWDPGPPRLLVDGEVAVIAYRIVQEALTNVARHAQAKHIAVALGEQDGVLTVEVRDDGRGISDDEARSPRSLGIVGMRERALVRGGALDVSRLPEGGTSVRLTIPVERRRGPRAPR